MSRNFHETKTDIERTVNNMFDTFADDCIGDMIDWLTDHRISFPSTALIDPDVESNQTIRQLYRQHITAYLESQVLTLKATVPALVEEAYDTTNRGPS